MRIVPMVSTVTGKPLGFTVIDGAKALGRYDVSGPLEWVAPSLAAVFASENGAQVEIDRRNAHSTSVTTYLTGARDHKAGQMRARCASCGPIGPVCDYTADAEAIAARHAEIGGFES